MHLFFSYIERQTEEREKDSRQFNVDHFGRELMDTLCTCGGGDGNISPVCRVEYKPIVIDNYVGLTSLVHNANSLGFYKVRGKVSF